MRISSERAASSLRTLHHKDLDELRCGIASALAYVRGGVYLSRTQVAERIGVTPGALSRYKLPEADAMIGTVRGWLPETIDAWQARRPGRGARTDLTRRDLA